MQNIYLQSFTRQGLVSICLLLALAFSPIANIAQDKKGDESKKESSEEGDKKDEKKKKSKFKDYSELITEEAKTDSGLFITHIVDDKFYFELSPEILEREILIVSRMSGTTQGLTFGGAGQKTRPQQVIRWQKHNDKLMLRSVSHSSVASEDKPIYQSVRNNNFEPIIMTFDIQAMGIDTTAKDTTGYLIEVSKLFTTDVPMIGALYDFQRKSFQIKNLDKSRTMITSMKSFPQNVEVRHILTYNGGQLPSNGLTQALTVEMNQSFVLLPDEPMMARMYDGRVNYFSIRQTYYGDDEQKADQRRFITRWRLEPKDPAAFRRGELVEPVKPIVYYIDPSTPEVWRPYLKQGIEDWQKAFEAAGFKNAIIAKDPPSKEEDPDWSPEDIRYSVIRYITNPIQNAQGPHVHDPRSGEILESDILWYHNVMNLLRNWFFIQTAAINPDARSVKFKDEVMGRLIRFVSAHEVGHTLGLPHNMAASSSYPVDSLRSPSFTAKMGTAPSIMDYARFNYVAQPEDKGVALMPDIGIYDIHSIRWGYRPILDADSPQEEKATLNEWITEHADDPMYRFGFQNGVDPTAQTEDLGDDAVKASNYGIANLKRIVPNLIEWTQENGKDYSDLQELYGQVLGQFNRYTGHVTTNIGGVYEFLKTYDQEGVIYEPVSEARQRDAMAFLQRELFQTPEWMIDGEILRRIESTGMIERIRSTQVRRLNSLLSSGRLARMIEAEAMIGNDTYTMLEMMRDLRTGIWAELYSGQSTDTYRRNLQRAYVERMEYLMTEDSSSPFGTRVDVSQSDIRAAVRAELTTLQKDLKAKAKRASDDMTKFHYLDALERVNKVLGKDKA